MYTTSGSVTSASVTYACFFTTIDWRPLITTYDIEY
eukprot:UN12831